MSPEERDDLPQEPSQEEQGGAPEGGDVPPGAPGEPGEATPSEPAPEPEGDAVGPEIEGAEELAEAEAAQPPPRERRPRRDGRSDEPEEEVIPGMHLEPDLVLEEQRREDSEFGQYAEAEEAFAPAEPEAEEEVDETPSEPAPVVREPLDLAADARYGATGKRKSAVARVVLKPGEGTYQVNGRHLDEYFPRVKLQRVARQPLEAAGYHTRMDVVARIHGGGVSAQATALRHGVARALVEADPALRGELKRRGYLTRDPRVKERKKAGLKKARKRPQFSKR
jgi:small subunit ribosomal protein S9